MGGRWVVVGVLILAGCLLVLSACSDEVCRRALEQRDAEVAGYATAFWELDATVVVYEGVVADLASTLQAEQTRCAGGPRPTDGGTQTAVATRTATPSATSQPSAVGTQTRTVVLGPTRTPSPTHGVIETPTAPPEATATEYVWATSVCGRCAGEGMRWVRIASPNSDCLGCQ